MEVLVGQQSHKARGSVTPAFGLTFCFLDIEIHSIFRKEVHISILHQALPIMEPVLDVRFWSC